MNSTNPIFIDGKQYTYAELKTIIAQHEVMYNFLKGERARLNGDAK